MVAVRLEDDEFFAAVAEIVMVPLPFDVCAVYPAVSHDADEVGDENEYAPETVNTSVFFPPAASKDIECLTTTGLGEGDCLRVTVNCNFLELSLSRSSDSATSYSESR